MIDPVWWRRGAHALMVVGMAGMFSPWGDPVPPLIGSALFGTLAAWFLSVRLQQGGSGVDAVAHTAIGSAAMAVMYLSHGGGAADPAAGHAGHHAAATPGTAGFVSAGIFLLLATYFLWHAWDCTGGPRERPSGSTLVAIRRPAVLAHVAMDGLMALMFLTTV